MPKRPMEHVLEFHKTYGQDVRTSPTLDVPAEQIAMRRKLIKEEVEELENALDAGDLVEVADALGDIIYVVYGAAITFGIDIDEVVDEIHSSNMSKLDEDGKPIYREDGKVLKGPNFKEPQIKKVLDYLKVSAQVNKKKEDLQSLQAQYFDKRNSLKEKSD